MATDELASVQRSGEIRNFLATAQTQVAKCSSCDRSGPHTTGPPELMLCLPLLDSAGEAFTSVDSALTAYFNPQSSKEKLFDCGCNNCAHALHNQLHMVGKQLIIKLNRFYTQVRMQDYIL